MAETVLARSEWGAFVDRLSRLLEGSLTEIEVAALGIGDQRQTEWLPLLGLAFDPKSDLFEVAVQGLDHLIRDPESLVVQQEGALVRSLVVATRSGDRHVLRFREPLSLPPPGAGR